MKALPLPAKNTNQVKDRSFFVEECMTEELAYTKNYCKDTSRCAQLAFEDLFSKILVLLNLEDKIRFGQGQAHRGNFNNFATIFNGGGGYGVNLSRENQPVPLTDHGGKQILMGIGNPSELATKALID